MKVAPIIPRATTVQDAERIARIEAMRRFGKIPIAKLEAGVSGDLAKFKTHASRAMISGLSIGLRLLALKERVSHGEFMPKCEAMGLTQPTAWRFMKLAQIYPVLPDSPPDGTAGPWSVDKALSYAKETEATTSIADLVSDELPAAELKKRTASRLATRKRELTMRALAGRVLKLEAEVAVALHDDQAHVLSVLHTFVQAASRLDAMAKQLNIAHA